MNRGSLCVAPAQRASHAERELTVDILRIAAGDGRITVAELDERLEVAFSARTTSELAELTADLPEGDMLEASHAGSCPSCRVARLKSAQITMLYVALSDDLSADRWAYLQSLLAKPRTYRRRPVSRS